MTAQPKFHHYVPQFLIRNFSLQRKKKKYVVNVYDKAESREFASNVDSILGETHFNRVDMEGGGHFSAEEAMTWLEGKTAPIIARIIEEQTVSFLSEQDSAYLCLFMGLQMNRGPSMRNAFAELMSDMKARIIREYGEDHLPDELKQFDENEKKKQGISITFDGLSQYALILAEKDLRLMIAPEGEEFLLGDNPVTMDNATPNDGLISNLGLLSKGIEIYLPIAPKLTIAFWCPSILRELQGRTEDLKNQIVRMRSAATITRSDISERLRATADELEARMKALEHKFGGSAFVDTIRLSPDQVIRQNSLQVAHAERYLIARHRSFDLPRRMIRDNARYRRGRRIQMDAHR